MDGAAVTAAGGELMWNTAVDGTVAGGGGELLWMTLLLLVVMSCCYRVPHRDIQQLNLEQVMYTSR